MKADLKTKSSHKPGSQFLSSFSYAFAESLRTPHMHTGTNTPPHQSFPSQSASLASRPTTKQGVLTAEEAGPLLHCCQDMQLGNSHFCWEMFPLQAGFGLTGERPTVAAVEPASPQPLGGLRCAGRPGRPFSLYALGEGNYFHADSRGEAEIDKFSCWEVQLDVLSNYCPCRASCHFQPGALCLV